MAYARSTFNIDAAKAGLTDPQNRQFDVSFPYLDKTHVKVLVNGVETSSFSWVNDARVELTSAPVVNDVVVLVRETSPNSRLVDYQTGSVLSEEILDQDSLQGFYLSQEANDVKEITMAKNALDQWEGGNRKIQNLTDPADAQDAVTKNYLETVWLSTSDKTQLNSLNLTNLNTVATNVANVNTTAGSITNVNTVAGNIANVNKVAAVDTQVTTVANNDANVTTVATDIANVNTTAGSISGVNTTAGSIASVNTVATNIADVNAVSGNNANVTAVANNATNINSAVANAANINAVVANATNINTVSANNANVTKVANIDGNVTTVANNDANVTTVAGISGNVTTVAGISADVTTVATNNANVTAVSGNAANINAVAGNATNINAVAGNATNINAVNANSANINTVAGINADVTTVASNIAAIQDAPNQASAAAASAVSAASSAATAATLLDNFDDRYLGAKTSDPALDNDGDALITGALYFNTTDGVMKIYTTSGWIAASSASVATLNTFEFVATAGQTVFSGNDANGVSLSFTDPALMVSLNGVRLRPGDDFTTSGGTSITLLAAATAGDELVVDAFGNFLVANTYTIAQADTLLDAKVSKSGDTMTGNLIVNDNVGVGTSSPAYKLDARLSGTSSGAVIQVGNTGSGGFGGLGVSDGGTYPLQIWGSSLAFLSGNSSYASATERMRIDSAGRVTMPYQPTFHAYRDAGNVTSNAQVVFNKTVHNNGGHYSTSTGRFTAPVAGYYFISAGLMNGGEVSRYTYIRKNGSNHIYHITEQNASNYWDTANFASVIYLNSGDYVDVYLSGAGSMYMFGSSQLQNYFMGYLLG